jgi:peptidoglycan/LPS O-acetylase OafA/YrhL
MGMSLFFTLSGFLITRLLLKDEGIFSFIIKRFFRIVPLAWLVLTISLLINQATFGVYISHLLFYANLPPITLISTTSHFWSLCVEMQFYVAIAIFVQLAGGRYLTVLPVACLLITLYRITEGAYIDIVTIRRVDEILAGCILALAFSNKIGDHLNKLLCKTNTYIALVLLAFSCHPDGQWMNYLRPYFAAVVVGSTLFDCPPRLANILKCKLFEYIAAISFALYVFHGSLRYTWLGMGDGLEKYVKRPILFAVTFALAHISTFNIESRFIMLGRQLAARTRS